MAVVREFHTVSLPPSEDEIKASHKSTEAQKRRSKVLSTNPSPPDARRKITPPNALFFCGNILPQSFQAVNIFEYILHATLKNIALKIALKTAYKT